MEIVDYASQILEQEKKEQEALKYLIDRQFSRNDRIFVHKSQMGDAESYVGALPLEWIATKIGYAHQLPLFAQSGKLDDNHSRVIVDEDTVDTIQQRPLDWTRQAVLAQYLALREHRKFPALLVAGTRAWVDEPGAKQWQNEMASEAAIKFVPLDAGGRFGYIEISDDLFIYALDGQHRLMGIKGLMELISFGQLQRKNKDGFAINNSILTLEELPVSRAELQLRAFERVSVEFISAVNQGDTIIDAHQRTRSIFVHVNQMAAPLTKSHLAMLDEDDGFAIIARRIAVHHELFKMKPGRSPRVSFDSSSISTRSTVLTTLQTLKEMATRYVGASDKFASWKQVEVDLIPERPGKGELEAGYKEFARFLDGLMTLESFEELERGSDTGSYRRFAHEGDGGQGHMLFRPIGQIALAQAMGQLVFGRGLTLELLFKRLREFDKAGGFQMEQPSSVWYMVLYDPNKQRIMTRGRDMAARLLVYLLGGGIQDPDDREQLREALAVERTIEGKAYNYDGTKIDPENFKLPPAL